MSQVGGHHFTTSNQTKRIINKMISRILSSANGAGIKTKQNKKTSSCPPGIRL